MTDEPSTTGELPGALDEDEVDVLPSRQGELDAMRQVEEPVTVDSMVADLHELGVEAGETLFVHTAQSALGWVCGGPQAVCEALQRAVTEEGTVVLPTFCGQNSDPAVWEQPPIPDEWVDIVLENRPAYRPEVTPSHSVGSVPEVFRQYPGAVRSRHPIYPFAAWGADAEAIVAEHSYDDGLGDGSPLAELYDREARILMLGTDHTTNTSLHLAEYRADYPAGRTTTDVPILQDGERVRIEIEEQETSTDDFPDVGSAFEDEHEVVEGTVGAADCKLLDQPALVDFAVDWFEQHRTE